MSQILELKGGVGSDSHSHSDFTLHLPIKKRPKPTAAFWKQARDCMVKTLSQGPALLATSTR